jgi:hypothetical protein
MKTLLTMLLTVLGSAGAETVNCSTIRVFSTVGVYYETQPGFPNKPEEKVLWLPDLSAPLKLCGVTFAFDKVKQLVTMEAASFDTLAIISSELRDISTLNFPMYQDQTFGRSKQALSVDFQRYSTYSTYSVRTSVNLAAGNDVVLGIRFDGGKLTPLYYNNSTPSIDYPKAVKVIDVYAQSKRNPTWQRITINFKKPKIAVYIKAPFPTK